MMSILLTKCLLRAKRLSLSACTESVGWITWSSWVICDVFQFPMQIRWPSSSLTSRSRARKRRRSRSVRWGSLAGERQNQPELDTGGDVGKDEGVLIGVIRDSGVRNTHLTSEQRRQCPSWLPCRNCGLPSSAVHGGGVHSGPGRPRTC